MTPTRKTFLFPMAALLLAALGCGSRPGESDRPAPSADHATTAVDPEQKRRAVEAKDALFAKLSGRLMEVMGNDGPAAAIRVCSREAGEIADQVGEQHGVAIGRTSVKLRNPGNVAPAWAEPMIKKLPTEPQFVNLPHGRTGALLPIQLKAVCVVCHGEPDLIADDVKTQLTQLYPSDQATGFKEGDLRGWFWVEVPNTKPTSQDSSS